ncbi:pterin-4-alpha-carbinolamine dehydratase [Thiohalocapsa marina]|uniref:Pterin-4-alpha-carbinolamine dehydratase n=1 Tax=Thiohalocapsa marina TaxID=424902 RepID=A0A5M8FUI1_9GAMM|nr:pterin-4-alpha-carbinolamine dehydratase [Thiohalocapsa marina]KAA6187460.1 pterin-4-alpha-carbinolamine dehydratase [Thiohalocapsa marina]
MPDSDTAGWRRRERPLRLERRLEFADYEQTRVFLEHSESLSEKTAIYPNMSFGRTYVNLTLFADEGEQDIAPAVRAFAERVDALAGADRVSVP